MFVNEEAASVCTAVVFRVFESWTAGTRHPEGFATGQIHQGFFTVFRVPKTNAKLGHKCRKIRQKRTFTMF
jgi:hypothetical protein